MRVNHLMSRPMRCHGVSWRVMRAAAGFCVGVMVRAGTVSAAFTNTVTLELRQGEIPTTNGVPIVGATAYAGTVDTYVDAQDPYSSFGTSNVVRFGWYTNSPDVRKWGYLRFEGFENYLPSAARVLRARLFLTSAGTIFGNAGPDIFFVTHNWDNSLTWNAATNYPAGQQIGMMWLGCWPPLQPTNDTAWLDVSAYVQAWHDGSLVNRGLQFKPNAGWGANPCAEYSFYSSEHSETAKRPKLVIEYAAAGEVSRPAEYGGKYWMKSRVEFLRGDDVFEDTYIAGGSLANSNFATAQWGSLYTWNFPNPPRRALFRILMNHPVLASLAPTSSVPQPGRPRLVTAHLQYCTRIWWDSYPNYNARLYTLAEDWDVNQVTHLNRFTNPTPLPWAENWPGLQGSSDPMSNVVALVGIQEQENKWYRGGTKRIEMTQVLQGYVEGTEPNRGLLLAPPPDEAYDCIVYFTEFGIDFMRPTLVLQLWERVIYGTLITVR